MPKPFFQLRVKQVGSLCDFQLLWGQGQTLWAELNYPQNLTLLYQDWQNAYLGYYRQLRGTLKLSGAVSEPKTDWRAHLVQAEAALLDRFHYWLQQPELHQIRTQIAQATQDLDESSYDWVEVFLTCTPSTLARLPWETWDIGAGLISARQIRLSRGAATLPQRPVQPIHRQARVLVILGDDTGIEVQGDLQATQRALARTTQIEVVGWQPGQDPTQLKQQICQAIAHPQGWDVLLFVGHSNETTLTGGQLGIAPQVSLHLSELKPVLQQAQQRGLQFALFNSCEGLDIAQSLMELGLSQVAVMREPIHNRVAQVFLQAFLTQLAVHEDVHTALMGACESLQRQEQRLEYPSAYLVPSLFRHPEAAVFQIQPFGWWAHLKRWRPTPPELRWLAALLLLSLLPPVQDLLIDPRMMVQAAYRQVTQQVPAPDQPPVLLVEVDEVSLKQDQVQLVYDRYVDYGYLARLIDTLSAREAKVIGIDYVLDKDQEQPAQSQQLQTSIQTAIQNQVKFVFAARERAEEGISEQLADLNQTMVADVDLFQWYVELLPAGADCVQLCPLAYLLALAQAQQESPGQLPLAVRQPARSQGDLRAAVVDAQAPAGSQWQDIQQTRLSPWTSLAHVFFQRWWHPLIDFSIPEERAVQRVSACLLLGPCRGKGQVPRQLQGQAVLIGHGGYEQGGLEQVGDDNYAAPLARVFWEGERGWQDWLSGHPTFTGAEAHAYMVHHLLRQRWLIPVPDFLMVLVAAVLGKGWTLVVVAHPGLRRQWIWVWGGGMFAYFVLSLQIYLWGVLFPVVLPGVMLWSYGRRR